MTRRSLFFQGSQDSFPGRLFFEVVCVGVILIYKTMYETLETIYLRHAGRDHFLQSQSDSLFLYLIMKSQLILYNTYNK